MNTLAPSLLIGSSSFLQVTKTTMSSKFSQIRPLSVVLAAIEHLEKKTHRLIIMMGEMVCLHFGQDLLHSSR